MMDYENAKLIAEQTDGKLTAEDVINLMTYGMTNAQDMAPSSDQEKTESWLYKGEVDECN